MTYSSVYQCSKCGLSKCDSAMGSVLPQCNCDFEENKAAYDRVIEFINNMKPPKFIEYWCVENTGWTNGQTWFRCGGREPYHAKSLKEALEYIKENRWDDHLVKWRYVHVVIENKENKRVTTEKWTEV